MVREWRERSRCALLGKLGPKHFQCEGSAAENGSLAHGRGDRRAPESGDLADVIEGMGKPDALTLQMVKVRAPSDSQLRLLFEDPKLRRNIPKRLAECGYVAVANPDARESGGRWSMPGGKTNIYTRQELSEDGRLAAARRLSATASQPPPMPSRP